MDRIGRRPQESSSCPYDHGLRPSQAQHKLPPFRDIIPAHLHNEIDSKSHGTPPDHQSPNATSPKLQSQSSAMRSLAQGFDEMSNEQLGLGRPTQVASQRQSETVFRHHTSVHHSDLSSSYYTQNHFVNQTHLSPQNIRNPTPNLPSLRHMHSDRPSNGLETDYSMPFHLNDSFGYSYGNGYEPEHSHYSSARTPMYELAQQNHRTYNDSNGNSGMSPSPQARRLPTYDTSRGVAPLAAGYVDADYSPHSPHSMNGAPYSNFGMPGDAGDPRSKKRRGNLPKPVTDILRVWFHEHLDHPYPSEDDKQMLIARTGLTISQISNWFINARRRQLPALRNQYRIQDYDRRSSRQLAESEHLSS